jgi:hypothetical protein
MEKIEDKHCTERYNSSSAFDTLKHLLLFEKDADYRLLVGGREIS